MILIHPMAQHLDWEIHHKKPCLPSSPASLPPGTHARWASCLEHTLELGKSPPVFKSVRFVEFRPSSFTSVPYRFHGGSEGPPASWMIMAWPLRRRRPFAAPFHLVNWCRPPFSVPRGGRRGTRVVKWRREKGMKGWWLWWSFYRFIKLVTLGKMVSVRWPFARQANV